MSKQENTKSNKSAVNPKSPWRKWRPKDNSQIYGVPDEETFEQPERLTLEELEKLL